MALPAMNPFGLPEPTGQFPPTAAQNDPLFGVNPYARGDNIYLGPTPVVGLPDLAQRAAEQKNLMGLAQLSNLGLAPDTDPHTWTPFEAAAQTDQAIAKIASVNPEVAQRLSEQRTPGEDTGDGFFDSLKNVVGDVLHPALSLGGKVLDLVGRTANIVPNLAFDAIDGGEFNLGADVGGALTGTMRHNWNAVFQEAGWEGDGVAGFFRATLGLGLDIATDPLTWLIPAGAGAKAGEAAASAAEVAATRSATLLEQGAKVLGLEGEELGQAMLSRYDTVLKGAQSQGLKLGDDLSERIAGLVGTEAKLGEEQLLKDMFETADRVYKGVRTRSFATWSRKGEIVLSDGRVVTGKELKGVLEQAVKDGAFKGRATSDWAHARQIASSMGGVRFKGAVPFTSLRYISPAIPGSKLLGEKSVGFLARMASGQSGMNRLQSAIAHGDAPQSALTKWMEEGFDAFAEEYPDLATKLAGRGKNLGSMFYSASEQMGRITSHFESGAVASRAGLAGHYAHAEELRIKNMFNQFSRELAYDVTMPDGRVIQRETLLRDMESFLGSSLRKSKNTLTPEQAQTFARYMDYFPVGLDTTDPAAIESWFRSLSKNLGGPKTAEETARIEDKLMRMQSVASGLNDKQRQVLDDLRAVQAHARTEAAKKDALLGDVGMRYDQTGILPPEQADAWNTSQHPLFQEDFYMDEADASHAQYLNSHGISDQNVQAGEHVTGVSASRTAGGGAGTTAAGTPVRVRMNLHQPLVIDRRAAQDAAAMDSERILLEARTEADNAARSQSQALDAVLEQPQGTRAITGEDTIVATDAVTEAIRKQRPEADGLVVIEADGSVHATAFDHGNVKVVSDSAPKLVPESGYFHRTFTPQAREWLRGKVPKDGKKLLIAEPEVEAFLSRQTIGMDIDEAEAYIREWLTKTYPTATLPEQFWNTDIVRVHEAYIEKTANAIAAEMTGKASRRLVALGDIAPALFGRSPREQKYEWMLSGELLRSLAQKDSKLTRLILESHARDAARMEEQHAQLAKTAEQYGMFAAMVEESLATGVEVPDRFVQAARRYGATVAEADGKIARELSGISEAEEGLRAHLTTYADALEQVKNDPGVGHPGPGDEMSVIELGDGRQRVKGWHGTIDATDPVARAANAQGVDMSNNGFHLGTYDQAKARVQADANSRDLSIGYRDDPSSWPTDEVYPSEPVPPRLEGETDEAWTERIMAIPASPVQHVPREPDLYWEDVLFPVEAEGTFARGVSESEMGGTFSGSRSTAQGGDPVLKAQARAPYQGRGQTGIIYTNDVEGNVGDVLAGGESLVVFEPTDVHIATGTRDFEQAVKDGKVFRAPDGSVSTKRVAGSRRLTSREVASEQLDKLAARRTELEKLRRSLTHGDDAFVRPTPLALHELPRDMPVGKLLQGQERAEPWLVQGGDGFTVEELADSIADEGFRRGSEVRVQYDPSNGRYQIADGWHRTTAMDALGEPTVPVVWEEAKLGNAKLPKLHERMPSTREVAESAKSLGQTAAARAERMAKQQFAAGKRLKRLSLATNNAMNEANRAYAEFHGTLAKVQPALHKVETAGDLEGLTRLHVPGLEGYAMPSYIAEEFHSLVDVHGIGHLRESWRRYVMGPWKRWATYRWPGFHVRNFFGAFFNNWLGGVVDADYIFSWRVNHARDGSLKWAGRQVSDKEMAMYGLKRVYGSTTPTYDQVAHLLSEQGLSRANTMSVMGIGAATEATQEAYRAVGKADANIARRTARKFDGLMKNMGSNVEDFHRVAAWGRGMASTQGDTYGARAFVMMRHGDYADLTDAEDFVRDLVPFYKWMRTNTPYQLRMLAEHPAQLTLVHEKLKQYAYDVQGIDRAQAELQQPDYMRQSLAVPIPSWVPVVGSKDKDALKFAMFDLPYGDLYNGLNDYMSSALPVGRNILESYGFKQTLFSGVPLEGKYKPLSGVFNLPGVRDILSAAKLTQKGADGQLYMEDKLQNVLMAWPVFSRFRNFTESDPARVDNRVGGLFSMMAGVGIREGDYTQSELDFYYNEVRPLLDEYRSLGVQLPTVDDLQSAEVGAQVGMTSGSSIQSPFLAA